MVSRNRKDEENIRFPFLYVIVATTDVGFAPSIDIQGVTRHFGREQTRENAPNVWFSGP
jgi:hypothetical protein